jgi:cytochrome c oxidase subunit 2
MQLFYLSIFILIFNFSYLDIAKNWALSFQDPATPIMEGIVNFHNQIMIYLTVIVVFVAWLMLRSIMLFEKSVNKNSIFFTHHTALEIFWTIMPAIVLLMIAIPSFALLYSMDELIDPTITIKAVGHQWYWSYEYSDYATIDGSESLNFDSYMVSDDDLTGGNIRLLEVDNRVVLPVETHIRVLITSADVLHSWAVPSFGIKVDACPGRLNQTSIFIKREGSFFGQCSEICGVNHGFMPISIEAVSLKNYVNWIANKLDGLTI